jgi:hypothetical protein
MALRNRFIPTLGFVGALTDDDVATADDHWSDKDEDKDWNDDWHPQA